MLTNQPQQASGLDYAWLGKGLVNACCPYLAADANGIAAVSMGISLKRTSVKNSSRALNLTGVGNSSNSSMAFKGTKWYAGNARYTIAALVSIDVNNATDNTLVSKYVSNNAGFRLSFINQFLRGTVTRSGATVSITSPSVTDLGDVVLLSLVVHDDSLDLYIDNTLVASGVAHSSPAVNAATSFDIFQSGSSIANSSSVYMTALFRRELSALDIASLATNPWQVFRQPRRFLLSQNVSAINLSSNASAVATASGSITQAIELSSAAVALATATGVVNQAIELTGSAASVTVAEGIATLNISLSGNGFVESFASGAISQAIALESQATASATGNGELSNAVDLSGNAIATSAATGDIVLTATLSGAALANVLASANLDAGGSGLSGNADSAALAQGAVFSVVPITGSANAIVTGSGGLSTTVALTAAAITVASGSGDLTFGLSGLTGVALANALAGGSLSLAISLSTQALAEALATATLTGVDDYSLPMGQYTIRHVTPQYTLCGVTPMRSLKIL